MEKIKHLILVLLMVFLAGQTMTQELFHRKNLANIDVSQFSQQEISRFQHQFSSANMSELEVISYLMEKGLSRAEIATLLRRMDRGQARFATTVDKQDDDLFGRGTELTDPLINRMYLETRKFPDSLIFGSELFRNRQMEFAPNLQLATPVNYILGPGDAINVSIFGNQEIFIDQPIEPNGSVNIPFAGKVQVGGLTVEQAEKKIKNILIARGFDALQTGGTKLTISVNEYRTIPITVIGAKMPGNYNLPSVASAFHALVLSGGPRLNGTYRAIEVVRKGKIVQTIDLYKFIVHGDRSQDILLQENDVVNIPVYDKLVSLKGEVKRSGFFELVEGENFETLLKYAGSFTPLAYTKNIFVEQVGESEFRTRDILYEELQAYYPAAGDVIIVGSIANRFLNRVAISGAIQRPGKYGWDEGLMLSTLVQRAGGLLESALLTRGLVYRYGRDHENAYLRFVPEEILNGTSDLPLMDGDSIVFGDRRSMFPLEHISVIGEVNKPDKYVYGSNMTALDALLLAGGLKRSATANRIEIARRLEGSPDMRIATIIEAATDRELIIKAEEVMLQPMDIVVVKPNPDFRGQQVVYLEGEVKQPGAFVLLRRNERLSSVLNRAGGLTEMGDKNGVFIIRQSLNPIIQKELEKMGLEDHAAFLSLDSLFKDRFDNRGLPRQLQRQDDMLLPGDRTRRIAEPDRRQRDNLRANDGYFLDDREFSSRNQLLSARQATLPGQPEFYFIDTIAINHVAALLNKEDSRYDLGLKKDDRIVVLPRSNTVAVKGNVNNEVTVNYVGGKLKNYLDEAGGIKPRSQKGKIFVIEPNGRSRMTKRVLGFRKYPEVIPGSVVVVPEKPEDDRAVRDPATMAAIASILASASGLVFMISTMSR